MPGRCADRRARGAPGWDHRRAGHARRRRGVPARRATAEPGRVLDHRGSLSGVERLLDAAPAVAAEAGGLDGLALPFSLLCMPASLIPAFVAIVLAFARANGSEPAEGLLRRTLLAPCGCTGGGLARRSGA